MTSGANPRALAFPEGFLWGVATSSHQIEGGDVNNDWWDWEHNPDSGCVASSGDACDSFHRWPDDVDLVADLGLGAYRFSLEWSRIEPAEGEFSTAALDHYRRMCAACHERGVAPVVTFHHFTTPRWLTDRGGWEAPDAPERFARYVERTVAHLGDLIGWACTFNEPNVVAVLGYTVGIYPPGLKDEYARHFAVNDALVRAHRLAVDALRSGPGSFPVGHHPVHGGARGRRGWRGTGRGRSRSSRTPFSTAPPATTSSASSATSAPCSGPGRPHRARARDPPDPDGLRVLAPRRRVHGPPRRRYTGLPVLVTENGLATEDDPERIEFITTALQGLHRCISDGIDVRGYFVWSLLDNFEWHLGFGPKLGICAVDPVTFDRRPKPSAHWFGSVAKANTLTLSAG